MHDGRWACARLKILHLLDDVIFGQPGQTDDGGAVERFAVCAVAIGAGGGQASDIELLCALSACIQVQAGSYKAENEQGTEFQVRLLTWVNRSIINVFLNLSNTLSR